MTTWETHDYHTARPQGHRRTTTPSWFSLHCRQLFQHATAVAKRNIPENLLALFEAVASPSVTHTVSMGSVGRSCAQAERRSLVQLGSEVHAGSPERARSRACRSRNPLRMSEMDKRAEAERKSAMTTPPKKDLETL